MQQSPVHLLIDSSQPQSSIKGKPTAMATPSPRSCYVCKAPARKACSKCKLVNYCCVACQQEDWSRHKALCGVEVTRTAIKVMGDMQAQLPCFAEDFPKRSAFRIKDVYGVDLTSPVQLEGSDSDNAQIVAMSQMMCQMRARGDLTLWQRPVDKTIANGRLTDMSFKRTFISVHLDTPMDVAEEALARVLSLSFTHDGRRMIPVQAAGLARRDDGNLTMMVTKAKAVFAVTTRAVTRGEMPVLKAITQGPSSQCGLWVVESGEV